MPQPTPVSAGERLETLDVLRGFALLGILAMNIRAMAAPLSAYMNPHALFDYTGASRVAFVFTGIAFDCMNSSLTPDPSVREADWCARPAKPDGRTRRW